MPTTFKPSVSTTTSPRRPLFVLAAVVAPVVVWTILEAGFGHDLRAPAMGGSPGMDIKLTAVVAAGAAAGLAAWASLAALERWGSRPRTMWTALAVAVFLVSLGGPLGGDGVTTAHRWMLIALHGAVAGVLIPGLAATARGGRQ
jgi:hypothetical protein